MFNRKHLYSLQLQVSYFPFTGFVNGFPFLLFFRVGNVCSLGAIAFGSVSGSEVSSELTSPFQIQGRMRILPDRP